MLALSRIAPLTIALSILGCGAVEPEPDLDGDEDRDAGMTASEDGRCPTETTIEFDTLVQGETGGGWEADLGGWFDNSDVACTPWGGDYPAPYRVYSITIPPQSDWDVVVRPAPGVDVSVVAWQRGLSFPACNPLEGSSVLSCEVSNFEGAGGEESVWIRAVTNPYHAVILVATPPGGTPGPFELRVVNAS
jgi:hypothetical protein